MNYNEKIAPIITAIEELIKENQRIIDSKERLRESVSILTNVPMDDENFFENVLQFGDDPIIGKSVITILDEYDKIEKTNFDSKEICALKKALLIMQNPIMTEEVQPVEEEHEEEIVPTEEKVEDETVEIVNPEEVPVEAVKTEFKPSNELPLGYVRFDATKLGLKNEYAVNRRFAKIYAINRKRFINSVTQNPHTFELEGKKILLSDILDCLPNLTEKNDNDADITTQVEDDKIIQADPKESVYIDWLGLPYHKYKLYGNGDVFNTITGKTLKPRKWSPTNKYLSVRLSFTTNAVGERGSAFTKDTIIVQVRNLMKHQHWHYIENI